MAAAAAAAATAQIQTGAGLLAAAVRQASRSRSATRQRSSGTGRWGSAAAAAAARAQVQVGEPCPDGALPLGPADGAEAAAPVAAGQRHQSWQADLHANAHGISTATLLCCWWWAPTSAPVHRQRAGRLKVCKACLLSLVCQRQPHVSLMLTAQSALQLQLWQQHPVGSGSPAGAPKLAALKASASAGLRRGLRREAGLQGAHAIIVRLRAFQVTLRQLCGPWTLSCRGQSTCTH